MDILSFIFGILTLGVILFIAIAYIGIKFHVNDIEEENTKLKQELKKARLKK